IYFDLLDLRNLQLGLCQPILVLGQGHPGAEWRIGIFCRIYYVTRFFKQLSGARFGGVVLNRVSLDLEAENTF
ncbi:hypothetical protein CRG98_013756, partial [Punica granatum]